MLFLVPIKTAGFLLINSWSFFITFGFIMSSLLFSLGIYISVAIYIINIVGI